MTHIKNVLIATINKSLKTCLIHLEIFEENPSLGETWNDKDKYLDVIDSTCDSGKVVSEVKRKKVVNIIKKNLEARCGELPEELDKDIALESASYWKLEDFYLFPEDNVGEMEVRDPLNTVVFNLSGSDWVKVNLELKKVDCGAVIRKWKCLKRLWGKLHKNGSFAFPPES